MSNTFRALAASFVVLCMLLAGSAKAQRGDDFVKQSPPEIIAGIESKHPVAYYVLASKLFQAGDRDEAVFWFYTGQIRWRARLMGNPQLPRDGEPALFSSMSEVVGRPINEYAFGDIPALAKAIDRALDWDSRHADRMNKAPEREKSRSGLMGMKAHLLANADSIRETRSKSGLENRAR